MNFNAHNEASYLYSMHHAKIKNLITFIVFYAGRSKGTTVL